MNNDKSFTSSPINWYPGHMVKAQNEIKEFLKLIDIVLEVLDARAPLSSRNPIIEEFAKDKQRIIILNKSDLADEEKTKQFVKKIKRFKYWIFNHEDYDVTYYPIGDGICVIKRKENI